LRKFWAPTLGGGNRLQKKREVSGEGEGKSAFIVERVTLDWWEKWGDSVLLGRSSYIICKRLGLRLKRSTERG